MIVQQNPYIVSSLRKPVIFWIRWNNMISSLLLLLQIPDMHGKLVNSLSIGQEEVCRQTDGETDRLTG